MKTDPYKIRAGKGRVLLQFETEPDVTDGGIAIPETSRKIPHVAVLFSTGPGVDPMLGVGQRVVCSPFAGQRLDTEEGWWVMVHYESVMAVIE